jgi:hypothetical protein
MMQIFCPNKNTIYIADILDKKRRNKQILEICQLLSTILNIDIGWKIPKYIKNHPTTKLYNSSEGIMYLVDFLFYLLYAYKKNNKKYRSHKCEKIFIKYFNKYHVLFISFENDWRPKHLNNNFYKKHQQLLLEKDYEYYSKYFC